MNQTIAPETTRLSAPASQALENVIEHLVGVQPSESPFISAYLDVSQPLEAQINDLQHYGAIARAGLACALRRDFDFALSEMIDFLRRRQPQGKPSLAIFSRWGDFPHFSALEIEVSVERQLVADALPMIYPLIALKDKLSRFVVVITSETKARIMEVVIGQVTESLLKERPDLRKRVGREWTKAHFQSHKRHRHSQFIKEKVELIEGLMARKGYNHLVIMGSSPNVARLTQALPKRLQDQVITLGDASASHSVSEAVQEAVQGFIEAEEAESQTTVERLHAAIMRDGLGVAGHESVLEALEFGQADTLVILDDYPQQQREALVRAAVNAKVNVETVCESELLSHYGGAGCLLRYRRATPSS